MKLYSEALRAQVEGAGWACLDDETKELLKRRDDPQLKVRRVQYEADQLGCPKVLS